MIETLVQDVRYSLRQLRRSPGFTAVAVLTLALGIGANTAIFTLIDAVMLRMLPVEKPEELFQVQYGVPDSGGESAGAAYIVLYVCDTASSPWPRFPRRPVHP